jgi:predicted acyltransferase
VATRAHAHSVPTDALGSLSPAGLTVCLMIFVDNLGDWFQPINHSSWNYVTLADFVMPFFLFMVSGWRYIQAAPPIMPTVRVCTCHRDL